ncbi:DUF2490 domain-containing protein [Oscillatoria amoena NRMC-F 0135]|nr:DUF2490 domain-containing protein [Oscillatoria amoena NRMC-F 0135]
MKVILCLAFFMLSLPSLAQDQQLWLEYQLSYPFGGRYLFENTSAYQTLLSKEDKWRSISISPVFEYVLLTRIELLSELPIGYTQQKEGASSFELMPMVGARFHLTQNKRIDTRFLWRYQFRYFHQIEAEDWEVSNRTRLRAEAFISLNGPNLFSDKLWYLFLDYEEFLVFDQQVSERYANRRRARIGMGYRFNYKHRLDLGYTWQSSRNEIEDSFISTDGVIQLKYKIFLNPATPSVQD